MPSPWSKNARSVAPQKNYTSTNNNKTDKSLSKKGKSLMYYEPDQDMLLAVRNLRSIKMYTRSTTTTRTFLKSSSSSSSAAATPPSSSSSSCYSVAETLPYSASSMSDDEPSLKSFKTWLKAGLCGLEDDDDDEIIQSTTTTTTTSTTLKEKMNENKNDKNDRYLLFPHNGFYSNNHVMVNRERALLHIKPLHRSRYLDSLALSHALDLAEEEDDDGSRDNKLAHSVETLPELRRLLSGGGHGPHHCILRKEVGENVQSGVSIRAMHAAAMQSDSSRRRNILREAYTEFGMATALGNKNNNIDGGQLLYMVQLFRGPAPGTSTAAPFTQQQQQQQDAAAAETTTITTTKKAMLHEPTEIIHHDDEREIEF